MYLLIIIVALIVWGVYKLWQAATPKNPPINDTKKHLQTIMQLPEAKSRRKYLKQQAKQPSWNKNDSSKDNSISLSQNGQSKYNQDDTSIIFTPVGVSSNVCAEKPVVIAESPVLSQNPTEGIVLDNIRKALANLGFISITATRIPNNQGVWIGCYFENEEYIFSCRFNSLDLDNEKISAPLVNVFSNVFVGIIDTDEIISYYNKVFTEFGFYSVHINTQSGSVIFVSAYHSDIMFKFQFSYPNMEYSITDTVDIEDNTETENIDNMDGHEFENYCAKLLTNDGFENVVVTQGSGDQGIDILATKDSIKYGIQCKCYTYDIGNKAVQEAFSGKTFYKCHVGAVLTNQYFTRSAKELAEANGVLLWDREFLLNLIEKTDKTIL